MLGGKPLENCGCPPKKNQIICTKCNENTFSLGLVLLARIGLEAPEEKYLTVLN